MNGVHSGEVLLYWEPVRVLVLVPLCAEMIQPLMSMWTEKNDIGQQAVVLGSSVNTKGSLLLSGP